MSRKSKSRQNRNRFLIRNYNVYCPPRRLRGGKMKGSARMDSRIKKIADEILNDWEIVSDDKIVMDKPVFTLTVSENDERITAEIRYKNKIKPDDMEYYCKRLAQLNDSDDWKGFSVSDDGTVFLCYEFGRSENINNVMSSIQDMTRIIYRYVISEED